MLKRLELVGFKSFADKTQFDFANGITAIVGPNGSGKSNIVDAVRWILGEQSAKSLRGGEMADVIFNGSASRRSFGMAEVSMIFDNSRRTLNTDADEVQITRRVYRSGEGEYLINRQPSRLKDIKELFLGSGAGADAYCVIEQGKVDVLLQASTKERRVIFEEAAGISRFKAKKIETLRKLERVDQNLQRLKDIIDEVEKQLRSVKLQASKAQRYQEYSDRLKELRVALGLVEYRTLSQQLEEESGVLDGLRAELAQRAEQSESWEREMNRLEAVLGQLETSEREQDSRLSHAREQIASAETTLGHERTLSENLQGELAQTRSRMTELSARVTDLAEAAGKAADELDGVEKLCAGQRQGVERIEAELQTIDDRLADLQRQVQADKGEHMEQMRQSARLQNDVVSYQAQVGNLRRERDRLQARSAQAEESLASLDQELQALTRADEQLQARLSALRQTLFDQRQERERLGQRLETAAQTVADLKSQRSGLASRIEVLEGLERSHEGLGAGVREVFTLIEQADPGPWQGVLGLVADFLSAEREYAPLIDLALGERAQRFLVRDPAELEKGLGQRAQPLAGRVSFLPLSAVRGAPAPPLDLADDGVLARADQVVRCDQAELADLPARLLGDTLIVRRLADARRLQARLGPQAIRFVTLQGELLEADGTLTVGAAQAEAGILSRKSELRELRHQADELEHRIHVTESDLSGLRERISDLDDHAVRLQQEINELAERAADLRSRLNQHRERREGLHEEVVLSKSELSGLEQEIASLEKALARARTEAETAEQRVRTLLERIEQAEHEIRILGQKRQERQHACTEMKVGLAQVEERLSALRTQHRQLEADLEQRRLERQLGERHLAAARNRLDESLRTMLEASAALAEWYLRKEAAERQLAELAEHRARQHEQRHLLAEKVQAARASWQALQEQAHARELVVNDLRHHRDTLADRLREDYQIELAELYQERVRSGQWPAAGARQHNEPNAQGEGPEGGEVPSPAASEAANPAPLVITDPAVVNEEIAELRRKLSRLGSVNLDSLHELAELEARASALQTQYDDLTAAQSALQQVINQINQDSRRLFTETFQSIRGHFQELFRKLFGGGMADIVLEDENDILESGIEIIARPPGKELRSISLMSGGEKTMTAVALLMAIFRSKPSPFCILDEVDAALDEANIGRFTAVLREFLDQSQFILVTHSKKTMATADVLYGITMQESGISKQVAVRFEDWTNGDGTPPPAAPESAGFGR